MKFNRENVEKYFKGFIFDEENNEVTYVTDIIGKDRKDCVEYVMVNHYNESDMNMTISKVWFKNYKVSDFTQLFTGNCGSIQTMQNIYFDNVKSDINNNQTTVDLNDHSLNFNTTTR